MEKKKLKIGFIMGGGVSMGSYSAGALSYFLENLEKAYDKDLYDNIVVDVFAGSSAGSAALAMTIFELIKGKNPEVELKNLWIDSKNGLDIKNLLHDKKRLKKGRLNPSLLSAMHIKSIMEQIFKKDNMPQDGSKRKSILGEEVRISMSLSNLNGMKQDVRGSINDGLQTNNPCKDPNIIDTTKTYWHNDSRQFKINFNDTHNTFRFDNKYIRFSCSDSKSWKMLAETARASGAFPAAFPPVALKRYSEEYGRLWGYEEKEKWFHYVDGGIFNNQPLKHAMNMAYDLDKSEAKGSYERFYIVIDPIVGSDKEDILKEDYCSPEEVQHTEFTSKLIGNVKQIVNMLTSHAQYKDWQKAYKVNNQLDLRQIIVDSLLNSIHSVNDEDLPNTDLLSNELEQIIVTKYKATAHICNSDHISIKSYVQDHLDIIENDYDTSKMTSRQRKYFLLLIALLDNATGLRKKQKVRLIGVAPKSILHTHGEFLSGFGGFFKEQWRQFDYEVGRYDAFKKLSKFNKILVDANIIQKVEDPAYSEANIQKDIDFENIPQYERKLFKKYLSHIIRRKLISHFVKWYQKPWPLSFITWALPGIIMRKLSNSKKNKPQKDCLKDKHIDN